MGQFSTIFKCLILVSVIALALSNPTSHHSKAKSHKKVATTTTTTTTTTPEPTTDADTTTTINATTTTTTTHRSIFKQILRGLTGPHPEDRIKKEEAEKKRILEEKSLVPHQTKDNFEVHGHLGASRNDY